jgi:Flp pilus assembly protein TadD
LILALLVVLAGTVPVSGTAGTPASADREIQFGIKVAQVGLWQEARFRFERAVSLDPHNALALNNLAVAFEQQGDFAHAREAYEKASSLRPKDASIQQNFELFRQADEKRKRREKTKPR